MREASLLLCFGHARLVLFSECSR